MEPERSQIIDYVQSNPDCTLTQIEIVTDVGGGKIYYICKKFCDIGLFLCKDDRYKINEQVFIYDEQQELEQGG